MAKVAMRTRPWWVRLIAWLGLTTHLSLFLWYVASGLLAPGWAVAVLIAIWFAFLAAALYLMQHRPLFTPVVPLAALVVWLLAISGGEAWLGWTA